VPFLQDIIHKIEVAGGVRYIRYSLTFLVALFLIILYNARIARNMSTQEAMDAAQLARNIAAGKGYTTSFIRPFSMHLVATRNQDKLGDPMNDPLADYSRIRRPHPDTTNPPVYPLLLAGLMKVLPFDYTQSATRSFWSSNGRSWRSQPDFLISWMNELLFFGVIVLVYKWARRLLDSGVAVLSALLLFGSELLWRFSTSGLPTMLMLLIFTGVVWCLTLLEQRTADPARGGPGLLALSAATGALIGLGTLTRYGFGWIVLPALAFVFAFTGPRRVALAGTLAGTFLVVILPWIIRNYTVSGALFGTVTYNLLQGPVGFPGYQLERSLHPDIQFSFRAPLIKLLINARGILQNEFFGLAGGWVMALFLTGLLLPFRSPSIRHVRYFLVSTLAVLFVAQALTRTQLSEDSPTINSENLIVLCVPLIIVYAVSLFYTLLEQMRLVARQLRYVAIALFALMSCLPMVFALLPPRKIPIVYPPYLPPALQRSANWMRDGDLMMSDIPWAVAWYGRRQCVWLTLDALPDPKNPDSRENFFSINDLQKPIQALYLSPGVMDFPLQTGIIQAGDPSWGALALYVTLRRGKDLSGPFPLHECNLDFLYEGQLFLSDWKRWQKGN